MAYRTGGVEHAPTPEAALLSASLATIDTRLMDLAASGSWHTLRDLAEAPPRHAPLFTGFAYQTPARQALLDAWTLRGTAVPQLGGASAATAGAVVHATDPAESWS